MPFRFALVASTAALLSAATIPEVPLPSLSHEAVVELDGQTMPRILPPKLNKLPKDDLEKALRQALAGNPELSLKKQALVANTPGQCSIPLLGFKARSADHNNAPKLPDWNKDSDQMAVPAPLPACDHWAGK